ncbi:MAG: hypothetical protein ACLFOY_17560, partial [Desulfatibacillaceae bacterium]
MAAGSEPPGPADPVPEGVEELNEMATEHTAQFAEHMHRTFGLPVPEVNRMLVDHSMPPADVYQPVEKPGIYSLFKNDEM